MNIVITGAGQFVELQATSEKTPFDDVHLSSMLELGRKGVQELIAIQKQALA
jgi:ribonuclease PH